MSGHVTERLSALLDGELEAAERESVARHLEACAECARFLEELAAVDRLAAAEPVPAPEGYFDSFVARVRTRIRQAPSPARPRFAIPRWALAAAAAVVIGVATPLLLQRQWGSEQASLDRLEEQVARRPAAPAAASAPPVPAAAEGEKGKEADLRALGYMQETAPSARRDQPSAPLPTKPQSRPPAPGAFAPEPRERVEAMPPAPTVAPMILKDELRAREELAREGEASSDEAASANRLEEKLSDAAKKDASAPAQSRVQAQNAPPSALGAAAAGAAAPAPGPAAGLRKSAAGPSAAFRALAARPAATIAEARGLREAWRAFAGGASGSEADDARVRVIETGLLAYRLSAEPGDLALARRDAAAYLKREDARQKERVLDLLAGAR